MAAEHVVAARPDAPYRHAHAAPDRVRPIDAQQHRLHRRQRRVVQLEVVGIALQMRAGHAQRRDQHGDAAQQEHGAAQREEATQQHEAVLVHQQHAGPDDEQHGAGDFAHRKRPRNVRHIVEENVGQRRVALHVRNTFVHDHHHDRRDPGDEESVAYFVGWMVRSVNAKLCVFIQSIVRLLTFVFGSMRTFAVFAIRNSRRRVRVNLLCVA